MIVLFLVGRPSVCVPGLSVVYCLPSSKPHRESFDVESCMFPVSAHPAFTGTGDIFFRFLSMIYCTPSRVGGDHRAAEGLGA